MTQSVDRYWTSEADVRDGILKLFVVWIHRRGDQLAVQVGLHEQEGPIHVFQITDHDPDERASETASEGDGLSHSNSEDETDAHADENATVMSQDDDTDVEMFTTITAIEMVDEDDVDTDANDDADADGDNADADDRDTDEIDLHYSATRPRWTDPDHGREDVTTAELHEHVEVWFLLQHAKFFPMLAEHREY